MSLAFRTHRPAQKQETLPPEIYIPLVDSLFKDGLGRHGDFEKIR